MRTVLVSVLVIVIGISLPPKAISQKRVQTLQKTYTGDLDNAEGWLKYESFCHAARGFIPDCDIWLHGEFVDEVQS